MVCTFYADNTNPVLPGFCHSLLHTPVAQHLTAGTVSIPDGNNSVVTDDFLFHVGSHLAFLNQTHITDRGKNSVRVDSSLVCFYKHLGHDCGLFSRHPDLCEYVNNSLFCLFNVDFNHIFTLTCYRSILIDLPLLCCMALTIETAAKAVWQSPINGVPLVRAS